MRYWYLLPIEELEEKLLDLFEEENWEELEKFFQLFPDGPWWPVTEKTPDLFEVLEEYIEKLPPKWQEAIREELEGLV